MYLTLDVVKSLINLLTLIITYFWMVPLLGCFRAWVAKKMGDSTPEMLGFLTLDPFVHIDFIGLTVLCLFNIGWGVYFPIYLNNIQGRFANVRRMIALFSDTLLGFVIGVLTVIIIALFGYSYDQIMSSGSQAPSAIVAFYLLLRRTLGLAVFLMLINFIINFVSAIGWFVSRSTSFYNMYLQMFLIGGPLLICIVFGNVINQLMFYAIVYVGTSILSLFGM